MATPKGGGEHAGGQGSDAGPSALSAYFHVGLKGGASTKPPVAPSGHKQQQQPHLHYPGCITTATHHDSHSRVSFHHHSNAADVQQAPLDHHISNASTSHHESVSAGVSRGTTGAGSAAPGAEHSHVSHTSAKSKRSQVVMKPTSPGVVAALNAVLNKKEGGIRGLSAAPDESLTRDKVNKDVLMKMRETFARADRDGTGELTPEEFVTSFAGVLHTEDGSDGEALNKLFMRIDANSDGTVNWDEFSTYMLLESQGAANLRDLENSISFDDPPDWCPPEGHEHDKLITHITHATLPNGSERYVTCAKDGVVKVWNAKDLKLMRSLHVGKSWVTCAKVLPVTRKLAVTSFARCMKIYDLQTFEVCGQIPEIEYAPMAMDVWTPARHRDVEMVAFGDGGGFVRLYELRINPLEQKTSNDRYLDTVKWKHQHHTDWVTCVKYVEELNTVVAGSLDKSISLTDAEDRVAVKTLQGHIKGVTCVDWSPVYKFLVSGSQDRRIMLWNPFSQKPLSTLMGHQAGVTAVIVNDKDNQIVSLGADKQVKLWDIRNHKCIQTLTDRQPVPGGEEPTLLCATYNFKQKTLVTGALWPKVWRQTITASASCGHKDPVVRVLFNELFNEAVTADASGTVSVWYVPTGKLRFRFGNTHPGHQLTAINFDGQKRRLLTGSDNGEVKVWNFSSGACLCTLRPKTHEEVTSITTIRGALFRHFVVAGWDRRITCYEDPGPAAKESFPGRVIPGHKADILDMAVTSNNQLISVADDGEVCCWNMESGALKKRMMAPGHTTLPMNEQAIEAIRFMYGKVHHVFVTVGADRWLRFWDAANYTMLAEVFTGHILGETVIGLAVQPLNQAVGTGDAAGFVKVWDTSVFTGQSLLSPSRYREAIRELKVWRAHKLAITSMDWVYLKEGDFILTSSMDKTVSLWSKLGAFIGQFGACVWLLDTPGSWRSQVAFELDARDTFDLDTSKIAPKRNGLVACDSSSPEEGRSRSESPQGRDDLPPSLQKLFPGVDLLGLNGRASMAGRLSKAGVLKRASKAGDMGQPLLARVSRTGEGFLSRVSRTGEGMLGRVSRTGEGVGVHARMSRTGEGLLSRAPQAGYMALARLSGGDAAAGSAPTALKAEGEAELHRSSLKTEDVARTSKAPAGILSGLDSFQRNSARGTAQSGVFKVDTMRRQSRAGFLEPENDGSMSRRSQDTADAQQTRPSTSGGLERTASARWGYGGARPSTAPDDVARVLVASHHDRLRHVKSIRRRERPEQFEPGGRYSRTGSAWSRSGAASKRASGFDSLLPESLTETRSAESDSSSEHLVSESSSSDTHTSDEDVPHALWLDEFKMAKKKAGTAAQTIQQQAINTRARRRSARRTSHRLTMADSGADGSIAQPLAGNRVAAKRK